MEASNRSSPNRGAPQRVHAEKIVVLLPVSLGKSQPILLQPPCQSTVGLSRGRPPLSSNLYGEPPVKEGQNQLKEVEQENNQTEQSSYGYPRELRRSSIEINGHLDHVQFKIPAAAVAGQISFNLK